jgi:hypothetical protein
MCNILFIVVEQKNGQSLKLLQRFKTDIQLGKAAGGSCCRIFVFRRVSMSRSFGLFSCCFQYGVWLRLVFL